MPVGVAFVSIPPHLTEYVSILGIIQVPAGRQTLIAMMPEASDVYRKFHPGPLYDSVQSRI